MPGTSTLVALKTGEIQTSHARVIAREAPKKHRRSEAQFLELCRIYPSDTVARHPLSYESEQVYADLEAEAAAKGLGPIDAELALQRQQRSGSLRLGDDRMWDLRAKLGYITGRQLSAMLQAAVRSPASMSRVIVCCAGSGLILGQGEIDAETVEQSCWAALPGVSAVGCQLCFVFMFSMRVSHVRSVFGRYGPALAVIAMAASLVTLTTDAPPPRG